MTIPFTARSIAKRVFYLSVKRFLQLNTWMLLCHELDAYLEKDTTNSLKLQADEGASGSS